MHKKKHLTKPVLLTKTKYIGFARTPISRDDADTFITDTPTPESDYTLMDGGRFIESNGRRVA